MPSLVLSSVTKRYGVGTEIITQLDYTFQPHQLYCLRGKNGSGKTTLLSMLSLFSFPTEGQVFWGDLDIHQHPRTYFAHLGAVLPSISLPLSLTLNELVEWRLASLNKSDLLEDAHQLFETLHFDDRRFQPLGTYSSGMLRKAELILAMCSKPEILILDEPFETLDDSSRVVLKKILEDYKSNGSMVIMATHQHAQFEAIIDHYLDFPIMG